MSLLTGVTVWRPPWAASVKAPRRQTPIARNNRRGDAPQAGIEKEPWPQTLLCTLARKLALFSTKNALGNSKKRKYFTMLSLRNTLVMWLKHNLMAVPINSCYLFSTIEYYSFHTNNWEAGSILVRFTVAIIKLTIVQRALTQRVSLKSVLTFSKNITKLTVRTKTECTQTSITVIK